MVIDYVGIVYMRKLSTSKSFNIINAVDLKREIIMLYL